MVPNSFDYVVPEGLRAAVKYLQDDQNARVMAGGQTLLSDLKSRRSSPSLIVDLARLRGLRGIHHQDEREGLWIGAMTRYIEIANAREIKQDYAALAEAAGQIGDAQVRNWGTIGGNLAANQPGADLPAAILALEGYIEVVGANGPRSIPADSFFIDSKRTALEPGEIITAIELPAVTPGAGSAYEKMKNPANCYAVCGIAVQITVAANGNINTGRVAVTGAAAHPMRLRQVEAALEGKKANAGTISSAAELASRGLDGPSDLYASSAYRAHLATVLTERALNRAIERANAR